MFGFGYIYSHNSLTPYEALSALAVGAIIGIAIIVIITRKVLK